MAKSFLVDRDVLVDFLRGHNKAVTFVSANSSRIILSSIVAAELYAGVKGKADQFALDNFVSLFRIIPVTSEIAKAGGLYKGVYGESHGVGLADAIIAATCIIENAELKTLNVRHFPMLKGIKPAYRK